MDLIELLRADADLSDLLCDVCDVEILPEFQPPEDREKDRFGGAVAALLPLHKG